MSANFIIFINWYFLVAIWAFNSIWFVFHFYFSIQDCWIPYKECSSFVQPSHTSILFKRLIQDGSTNSLNYLCLLILPWALQVARPFNCPVRVLLTALLKESLERLILSNFSTLTFEAIVYSLYREGLYTDSPGWKTKSEILRWSIQLRVCPWTHSKYFHNVCNFYDSVEAVFYCKGHLLVEYLSVVQL